MRILRPRRAKWPTFVSGVPPRFVGFGFNPVRAFSIYPCAGTTLHLATPVAAGQWRVTVEADQIKLENYSLDTRSGQTAGAN